MYQYSTIIITNNNSNILLNNYAISYEKKNCVIFCLKYFIFFHGISSVLYDMTGLTGRYRVVGRDVNTIKLGEINI